MGYKDEQGLWVEERPQPTRVIKWTLEAAQEELRKAEQHLAVKQAELAGAQAWVAEAQKRVDDCTTAKVVPHIEPVNVNPIIEEV